MLLPPHAREVGEAADKTYRLCEQLEQAVAFLIEREPLLWRHAERGEFKRPKALSKARRDSPRDAPGGGTARGSRPFLTVRLYFEVPAAKRTVARTTIRMLEKRGLGFVRPSQTKISNLDFETRRFPPKLLC
jgi:hypothetical protein